MKPHWLMTWHEDREISPGVPDIHFVMKGTPSDVFRVGWIELKALDTELTSKNKIGIEPSQHEYIKKWAKAMPILFLVRVVEQIYLIPAFHHIELAGVKSAEELEKISMAHFHQSQIEKILPSILKVMTRI